MRQLLLCFAFVLLSFSSLLANVYFVNTTGSDTAGDGSSAKPWKTLLYAVTKVPANQGHTIQLAAGTFVESGLIEVPLGVNITGAGIDQTILRGSSSFFYHPATPGFSTDKFLLSLNGSTQVNGNQQLKGFTIDGSAKQLHGGVYVRHRNAVTIDAVKVIDTNFSGIWLWDVKDSKLANSTIINASWGSQSYCSGALNLGNVERVEVDHLNVDESTGYGIKAIGPGGNNDILNLKVHDSHISVNPFGLWNGGTAPNIAIELWQVNLVGNEIYNTYVDNTISLVNSNATPSTGVQTIRVHHNTIDMETRAQGAGYGVELTIHDAEVDHNYFIKGNYAIANWDNPMINWNIHHNTFYAIQGTYPGEVVRSQWSGLHNVRFSNNTVEFASNKTMNVIGMYGGSSNNIDIENNLFINNNTSYNYYPNQLVHQENSATLTVLTVKNNSFFKLPIGTVPGTYLNNITTDPLINATGLRADPYYMPKTGSPLINAGVNLGFPFLGSSPDIGAFESGTLLNISPVVAITSPANNTSIISGSSAVINATATDADGTISKVEFFSGTTLLGQDVSSPYSFSWSAVPAGNYILTAKATDNLGGITTSPGISISSVTNTPPVVTITSPLNNAGFIPGSSVTINANATDNGTIAKVEFFNGSTLLGQDIISPYSFTWSGVPAGTYAITAKATDNQNAVTVSSPVTIRSNVSPTVSITAPVNNGTVSIGNITITASASDTDGTISKVEFYNGTVLLGQSATTPYNYVWNAVPAGTYSLTAKAYDNMSSSKVSAPVSVIVNTPTKLQLGFDSSDAILAGGMTSGYDAAAGMASFFSMPVGSGRNYYIPAPAGATFNFNLSSAGNFVVWAKVRGATDQNQGHYIYNGQGRWFTWLAGVHAAWTWVKVTENGSDVLFPFGQGANNFKMAWFDESAQVDQILITNDLTYVPAQDVVTPSAMTIFPNPVVANTFTLQYTSSVSQQAQISIFDNASVLVKQTMVNLVAGVNNVPVDVSYVYNGPYIVAFQPAGDGKNTTRIVINH